MAAAGIDNKMGHHTWNEGQSAVERMFRLMSLKFFSIFFSRNFGINKVNKLLVRENFEAPHDTF